MDSDRLNRWLTLGANVGVLIGIALILVELNQNAELMRAQMAQERANHLVEKYDAIIHSEEWPRISAEMRRAVDKKAWRESLTPEEHERVLNYFFREVNDVRNQYYQHKEGFLPEEIYKYSTAGQMRRLVRLMSDLDRPIENLEPSFLQELQRIAKEAGIQFAGVEGQ